MSGVTLRAVAALACLAALSAPAAAIETCQTMLMPAASLKQVARGVSRGHTGLDLTAPYGSPVRAAMAGRVVFAGRYYGYGNMVDIRHDDGTVTRYAHLSSFARDAKPGRLIAAGAQLGAIGTSGRAHGAHLHFEVRLEGRPLDPKTFLGLASCTVSPNSDAKTEIARAPDNLLDRSTTTQGEGKPGGLFQ